MNMYGSAVKKNKTLNLNLTKVLIFIFIFFKFSLHVNSITSKCTPTVLSKF